MKKCEKGSAEKPMNDNPASETRKLPDAFWRPPDEFSLFPFWFWNDDLQETEIIRQLDDFMAHGVYGFVIHCRVGLPRAIGWMSDRMLALQRFAVEQAQQRGMGVILYDEGMYPSGSSCGQVVAANPGYACRCLARMELAEGEALQLPAGHNLVAVVRRRDGRRMAVIDRPVDSYIRGLHYIGDGPQEDEPPAADILNPAAVKMFIRLVYDRYAEVLGSHFGKTIRGIFTDEPDPLGRCRERDVLPGTTGILEQVNAYLGYDFTPHLPALWDEGEPDAALHRENFERAVMHCLEEHYYGPLRDWCQAHHIVLTGHPARPDAIGLMRYFDIPGQDLVWRWVSPGNKNALEGPESTQAKCSASAMIHLKRERNANECFGAYGHEFTWQEMKWLVDWCFVRGVNMLIPHAFYYSIRGPRVDERPPDVGPNSPWWDQYRAFADYCKRMCWVNTNSQHVCNIAILCENHRLPWDAAKILYQNQRDFNYLEIRHLWEDAVLTEDGVQLSGMVYQAFVVDGFDRIPPRALSKLQVIAQAGQLIAWNCQPSGLQMDLALFPTRAADLLSLLENLAPPDIRTSSCQPDLRCRHVIKDGLHYYLFVNEGLQKLDTQVALTIAGSKTWIDPFRIETSLAEEPFTLSLEPYTTKILAVDPD
jgi:hypothetical protein